MIAITVFNRERTIRYLAPIISLVGPEQRQSIMDRFRGVIFPEDHYDSLTYVKKAKEVFEKLKYVKLSIQPFAPSTYSRGWQRKEQK